MSDVTCACVTVTLIFLITLIPCSLCQNYCVSGYGFPESCPRPGDPDDHTQCCKNYYTPACCQPRANVICTGQRGSSTSLPSLEQRAIWCPGADQSDDMKACCSTSSSLKCCSTTKLVGGIVGGVLGLLLLIGLTIGITCWCCVRSGKCVCVQIRPGKYQMMTKAQAERYNAMMSQRFGQAPPTDPRVTYIAGQTGSSGTGTYAQPYSPAAVNPGQQ